MSKTVNNHLKKIVESANKTASTPPPKESTTPLGKGVQPTQS